MARLSLAPSSNLSSADYDEQSRSLTVTFTDGRSYRYSGVDKETAMEFESASSAGSFLNARIKGRFPHSRA